MIGDFEPMTLNMDADYLLDGGLVDLTHIDLWAGGDGFRAVVDGRVDMLNWPESTYDVREMSIDLPAMKEIFFARDNFTVTGEAAFHRRVASVRGRTRADRLVLERRRHAVGTPFSGARRRSGLDARPLGDYAGALRLLRRRARLHLRDEALGAPEPGIATFDPRVQAADLAPLLDDLGVPGARPIGMLAGELSLAWPLGRFAERRGRGEASVAPPAGVAPLPRDARPAPRAGMPYAAQSFEPAAVPWRFPFGGDMRFTFEPDGVDIAPSWFATPLTAMTFEGRTAWGAGSRIPFDVVSADWQESDRVMAAVMTAFGRPTGT